MVRKKLQNILCLGGSIQSVSIKTMKEEKQKCITWALLQKKKRPIKIKITVAQ